MGKFIRKLHKHLGLHHPGDFVGADPTIDPTNAAQCASASGAASSNRSAVESSGDRDDGSRRES